MFCVTIILILLTSPFLWWYLNLRKYKSIENIGGPKPLPFIGNVLDLGYSPQDLLKNCLKFKQQYGKLFKVFVSTELRVFITDADLVEQLLTSNVHITKSSAYDLLEPWIGTGLLTSTGNKWKRRRKIITPTFHFKILEEFIQIFNSASDVLVNKLSNEVDKETVDISALINLHSLDVICETAMGVNINAQENHNTEYVTAVKNYLDTFITRVFSVWQRFDLLFKFSPKYPSYFTNLKIMHRFSNSIILKKREEKLLKKNVNTIREDGTKRKTALLDMLLESEDNELLTNEDLREEIDTFMFEGHDTTNSAIAFTILTLAEYTEVQEKVYEEIQTILGSEQHIIMQHLQEMKYLEMVIKEVLRLYPSVPMIERKLETNYTLGGYEFPKDTILDIFVYGLHRSEDYFPNAEKFDPNRFLPENQSQRHKFAYVPFSAGPRNCIGQKFAMYEMKMTIIKIVRKFKILQVPNYKPELGAAATLKYYNGVCVRLQLRN